MKRFPFHPFLAAIFPVIFLFGENMREVTVGEILLPAAMILIAAGLLMILLTALLGWRKGAALTTLFVILFFSYGPALKLLLGTPLGRHRYLYAAFAIIFIAATWGVSRYRGELGRVTVILNAFSIGIMILPVHAIISGSGPNSPEGYRVDSPFDRLEPVRMERPDILHIVLDAYGRGDILDDYYGMNDGTLPEALRSRGFMTADSAVANYPITYLSLSSILNGIYHDTGGREAIITERKMIQDNGTVRFLRRIGYRYISIPTGPLDSDYSTADEEFMPVWRITPLEQVLINSTPLTAFTESRYFQYRMHRMRIEYAFSAIPGALESDSPAYIFAHIMAPHPPFVFRGDGGFVMPDRPFGYDDGSEFYESGGTREEYIEGYREEVRAIDEMLLDLIDTLITRDPDLVVIIHGDHGPGSGLNWREIERSDFRERAAILLAVRIPGEGSPIPEDISAVNLMGTVFNRVFGTGCEARPDRVFASSWYDIYNFIDITDAVTGSE